MLGDEGGRKHVGGGGVVGEGGRVTLMFRQVEGRALVGGGVQGGGVMDVGGGVDGRGGRVELGELPEQRGVGGRVPCGTGGHLLWGRL